MLVLVLLLLLESPRIRRDTVSDPVEPRVKSVWHSRGKTIAGGLPLLSKITPVVGRMAETVPASNVAVRALAKDPLVTREPISVRVLRWW